MLSAESKDCVGYLQGLDEQSGKVCSSLHEKIFKDIYILRRDPFIFLFQFMLLLEISSSEQ